MKLIDSQGKLFGKYNIIDLLIVFFIICVLGYGIFSILMKEEIEEPLLVRLKANNQPDFIYNNLKIGDRIIDKDPNKNNSKIIDIIVDLEHECGEKDLIILAELETKKDNEGLLFFNNEEIRVGKSIFLSTPVIETWARIIDINESVEPYIYENKIVTVRLEEVESWIADIMKKGSKELLDNKTIAIVNKKTVIPSEIVSLSDSGDVLINDNPLKKDIELEIKLRVRKTEEGLIFKNKFISVGKWINFDFEDISFDGQIISIN
jgi:hypothetical protein